MSILNRFRKIAETEFFDAILSSEFIYDAPHLVEPSRLRLYLHDGSFIDVRYDEDEDEYSFHWQRDSKITRFNNAPYHQVKTFPRHIHLDSESNVVDDDVTSPTLSPEENFKRILRWIINRM